MKIARIRRFMRAFALGTGLLMASALSARHARADSLDAIFQEGNQAFAQGDYPHAVQLYQRLVDAGVRDPDVYLNLGLAHARNSELGPAVLAFEKSLRLRPSDESASTALGLARAAVGKRRAERHGEATVETQPPLSEALVRPFTQNTLSLALLICDIGLFGCLGMRLRARDETTRTGLALAATLFGLALSAVAAGLLIKRDSLQEGEPAIVLRDSAELREAPDPRALVRARAAEAGSTRILARDGGFAQVRTAAGQVGWIANTDVGSIID